MVILLFIHIFTRCKWKFNMRPESTNRPRFRSIISIQRDLSQEQAYIPPPLPLPTFNLLFYRRQIFFFVFLKVCTEPIYNQTVKKRVIKKKKKYLISEYSFLLYLSIPIEFVLNYNYYYATLGDVKRRKGNFTIDLPTNSKVGSFVSSCTKRIYIKKKNQQRKNQNRKK